MSKVTRFHDAIPNIFPPEEAIKMLPVEREHQVRFLVRAEQGKDLRGYATFDHLEQVVTCIGATLEQSPHAKVTVRRYRA